MSKKRLRFTRNNEGTREALVGLVMAIVSIFSLDWFTNPLVETVSSRSEYVLAVPILPALLALVGLIMAVRFLFKGDVLIVTGVAAGGTLLRRHREEKQT
ncbi:MAG: hypothetical protein ACR2HJ_10285 [Fimbriimonadales bacterium]